MHEGSPTYRRRTSFNNLHEYRLIRSYADSHVKDGQEERSIDDDAASYAEALLTSSFRVSEPDSGAALIIPHDYT